jgi:hypothetical protein
MGGAMATPGLYNRESNQRGRDEAETIPAERGDSMIEITNIEAVEDAELEKMAKIYPEGFGKPLKVRQIEKAPTCPNKSMPMKYKKRHSNALRRYISRFYRICLLNALATATLAVIYVETKNELFYSAMVACGVNAFIMWACAD